MRVFGTGQVEVFKTAARGTNHLAMRRREEALYLLIGYVAPIAGAILGIVFIVFQVSLARACTCS